MLSEITYRGPDQNGTHVLDSVALGHNRLTIMEPQGGRQPRIDERNGNTLVYNGEIYDHRAFDAEIRAAGCEFRDHCDTETLFWLIDTLGVVEAARRIDGMFAFAYYKADEDALYLARDPFGQKPLFYAEVGGELLFASEVKALRQHPSLAQVTPDLDALGLYLMMEYIPGTATGISEIKELPPGQVLRFCKGRKQLEAFWDVANFGRDGEITEESAVADLDARLNQAVEQQLVADVPVGVFLSGGLDSSLIAAIAKTHKSDVSTFTVKFPQASFDESSYAEEVAARIGTNHTTIELDQNSCIEGIEDLLNKADQPFADSSMLPTYLLCHATRKHVTVALGGDGADELFLGYPNFRLLRFAKVMSALPGGMGQLLRIIGDRWPQSDGYMNFGFLLRQMSYGIGKPANMQSVYWMAAVAPTLQQDLWNGERDSVQRIFGQVAGQVSAESGLSLSEQCQRHFLTHYLTYDILQKADRASMCASLELRSPFLSSGVAEYALRLPHELLFKAQTGKRVLRQLATAYLSERTIARKKHGFPLPVSHLIRHDLRPVVEESLGDRSNPMYQFLRFDVVDSCWQAHANGRRDFGKAIWALFMLAAFCRKQF